MRAHRGHAGSAFRFHPPRQKRLDQIAYRFSSLVIIFCPFSSDAAKVTLSPSFTALKRRPSFGL
jgi:hypothetical protein